MAILNAHNCSQLKKLSDRGLLLPPQPDHSIPANRQTFGQLPLIFKQMALNSMILATHFHCHRLRGCETWPTKNISEIQINLFENLWLETLDHSLGPQTIERIHIGLVRNRDEYHMSIAG